MCLLLRGCLRGSGLLLPCHSFQGCVRRTRCFKFCTHSGCAEAPLGCHASQVIPEMCRLTRGFQVLCKLTVLLFKLLFTGDYPGLGGHLLNQASPDPQARGTACPRACCPPSFPQRPSPGNKRCDHLLVWKEGEWVLVVGRAGPVRAQTWSQRTLKKGGLLRSPGAGAPVTQPASGMLGQEKGPAGSSLSRTC